MAFRVAVLVEPALPLHAVVSFYPATHIFEAKFIACVHSLTAAFKHLLAK
jgi:hypothetical protein